MKTEDLAAIDTEAAVVPAEDVMLTAVLPATHPTLEHDDRCPLVACSAGVMANCLMSIAS
jgi:hypothetical protein